MSPEEAHILVLDDEDAILEILTQHLTGQGYRCSATTSPLKALELLARERFSLLLADLHMPEMSGMEVVERAKALCPDLSIVVVTALLEVTNAIQAMRLGADDYVLKPFDLQEISMAVARALDKQRLVEENREYQETLEGRVREATEDLEKVNNELRDTKQYLENLLHSTVDAILTINLSGKVEFVNTGAVRMLGYEAGEYAGMPAAKLFAGGPEELKHIKRILREDRPVRNYETELRRKDGTVAPVNASLSLVRGADGKIASMLAICKDITEQKRLEQELKEMSIKDGLTGLYNQRCFYDRLASEIERARRQERPLSLLLFDIDQFKRYNDTHGHLEGDRVLQAVGHTVKECTRDHVDMGFRYGGDEFTVILPEADEAQACSIAERIRRMFEERHFDDLTLSIGVLGYKKAYSPRAFIKYADSLMYEAKRAGGNRVHLHRAEESMIETAE